MLILIETPCYWTSNFLFKKVSSLIKKGWLPWDFLLNLGKEVILRLDRIFH